MYIYIIIFVILLCLVLVQYMNNKKEKFYVIGHEEDLPNEYRQVNKNVNVNINIKDSLNTDSLASKIWEKRFRNMVQQKYSYNDNRNHCIRYLDLVPFARLKELPIGFDPCMYIDKKDTKKSQCNCYLRKEKEINGYDYNNADRITFNSGPGTSDSYYLEDKGY